MALIGKALYVPSTLVFTFTLTIGGSSYTFDNNSSSSEVSDKYKYVRDSKGWYLLVYANATLRFTKLKHTVDYTGIGGGGGGGGGTVYYNKYYGGQGGAGTIDTKTGKSLTLNTPYSISIGTGGAGGYGQPSGQPIGADGSPGTTTTFNDLSAGGGDGGKAAYKKTGDPGNTNEQQYCFGDSERIATLIGGYDKTNPGSGGAGGGYTANYGKAGDTGYTGMFAIRSSV